MTLPPRQGGREFMKGGKENIGYGADDIVEAARARRRSLSCCQGIEDVEKARKRYGGE